MPSLSPERGANYGLTVDMLSQKNKKLACVRCMLCRAEFALLPIGTEACAMEPRGRNLLGGLPTGSGYFGRVFLADRLPSSP